MKAEFLGTGAAIGFLPNGTLSISVIGCVQRARVDLDPKSREDWYDAIESVFKTAPQQFGLVLDLQAAGLHARDSRYDFFVEGVRAIYGLDDFLPSLPWGPRVIRSLIDDRIDDIIITEVTECEPGESIRGTTSGKTPRCRDDYLKYVAMDQLGRIVIAAMPAHHGNDVSIHRLSFRPGRWVIPDRTQVTVSVTIENQLNGTDSAMIFSGKSLFEGVVGSGHASPVEWWVNAKS